MSELSEINQRHDMHAVALDNQQRRDETVKEVVNRLLTLPEHVRKTLIVTSMPFGGIVDDNRTYHAVILESDLAYAVCRVIRNWEHSISKINNEVIKRKAEYE